MKTYVIHNNTELRLVITTTSLLDVTCNLETGEAYQEVESGFTLWGNKLVGGVVVAKTLEEMQAMSTG